jgi:hypoxanthine phosphoribosyltransferase
MIKYNFMKDILISSNEIDNRAEQIRNQIRQHYTEEERIVVITILEGGWEWQSRIFNTNPFFGDRRIIHFHIFAKSYGDAITSNGDIELPIYNKSKRLKSLKKICENAHVLIVDDIYDTGRTLNAVKKLVEPFEIKSVDFCVMVERKIEHSFDINPRFIGFKLDTKDFLVGCGLDFRGDYRNIPYIASIKKESDIIEIKHEFVCNCCGKKINKAFASYEVCRVNICDDCVLKIIKEFKYPITFEQWSFGK